MVDPDGDATRPFIAEAAIGGAQALIYAVVALLLLTAVGFTLVGTVKDVIEGSDSRPITDTGVFILDRVLLMFIIAELLYTLRLIDVGGRILVEPFLFIGLIAVVRKVLVLAAEFDQSGRTSDFLEQLAALGGLVLILSLAIYLLRKSASLPQRQDAPDVPAH
ncbi:MAG: hypothetical protein QOI98_274 [Solirubrobacteraceae bacterium]|nr:hypothetical protein [Solirubrobacteraceae bacterium]